MSDAQPDELDYAPPAPWHQRATTRKWAIGLAAIIFVLLTIRWMPMIYHHLAALYWQRYVVAHEIAPGTIVHEWTRSADRSSSKATAAVPEEWAAFYEHASPPGLQSGGTAFLEVVNDRIVAVDVAPIRADLSALELQARVFETGSLGRSPRLVSRTSFVSPAATSSIRIFAGTVSSEDPAHFTIDVERDGRRETVHGWLLRDDRIVLERGD